VGGRPDTSYVIGDDVLAQCGLDGSKPSFLLYDGHGSTRQLVGMLNSAVHVSDQYNYDAYGIGLGSEFDSGLSPATKLLYCGEQFDTDIQMYNLRARYYDPSNGRFCARDAFSGNNSDPQSLHKYAYASGDPANAIDPTGNFTLLELMIAVTIVFLLVAMVAVPLQDMIDKRLGKIAPSVRRQKIATRVRDLGDMVQAQSITEGEAFAQVVGYIAEVNTFGGKLSRFDFFNDLATMAMSNHGDEHRLTCGGDDDLPAGYARDGSGREGWLLDHAEDASFKGGNGAPGTLGGQTGRVDHFVANASLHFLFLDTRDGANDWSVAMGSNVGFGDVLLVDGESILIDSAKGSPAPGTDWWWDLYSNQMGRQFADWVYTRHPTGQEITVWIRSNILSQ
jgi:RHS repeat-associated protein